MKSVVDLPPGGSAKILKFENAKTASLLESMGLFIGQSIHVIHKSATIVIGVNHRMVAMSKSLARKVHVSL
ncbi:MAG: ferrous iron transport protein A [Holosporales bacterium]|nr:ferrous iron transport protein A [Holosporales bacterium]